MTPKAYAAEMRARRAAESLRTAGTVTEAIYDAGFNSSSRFYETATARLGMTPSAVRRGGDGRNNPLRGRGGFARRGAGRGDRQGRLLHHARRRPATRSCASCRTAFRARNSSAATLISSRPSPRSSASSRRPASHFDLPLDIRGTAFQQQVWQALRAIPPGKTATYTEIAQRDRPAEGGARGRQGLRRQSARGCDPLPSGGAHRRRPFRLPLGRRAQAQAPRPRGRMIRHPHPNPSPRGRGAQRRRQSLLPRGEGGPR